MVKTRSGIDTEVVKVLKKEKVWRYPKCTRKGPHGRCATCVRAGFTKEGYEKYFRENPRRALVRPPQRRQAPRPSHG